MFVFDSKIDFVPIYWVGSADWTSSDLKLSAEQVKFAKAQGFKGREGQLCFLPEKDGSLAAVVFGGADKDPQSLEALPRQLPEGVYKLIQPNDDPEFIARLAHIWADGCYVFDKYKQANAVKAHLALDVEYGYLQDEADALHDLRDWVNTPAEDLHPEAFQSVMLALANKHAATLEVVTGDELLEQNYPMINAVGRAGAHPPRYCELRWNFDKADLPILSIVGKGVCFDSGGLNIKTGNYMRLMKKDMGGAAHALALAQMIMLSDLPVRLQLGIPLVENNIAANAFRPGDVFSTRKGISVEIDNTDAEGRLILADALTKASEANPDLLIDFATLTGAARVALGPDLVPIFTDDDALAQHIAESGKAIGDPVWPMPLWSSYGRYLNSSVADMQNAGGRMAGAITAGLFLKAFVSAQSWAHFDVWAWREARFGSPEGAYPCGIRAVWAYLKQRFS